MGLLTSDAAKKAGLPLNPLSGDQVTTLVERIAAAPDEVVERIRTIRDSSEKK